MASKEDEQEILLSSRYGELDEIKQFIAKYGVDALANVRDDNENTVLHMIAANGHDDLLEYILPLLPLHLLSSPNSSKSIPLHWAATNRHLSTIKLLVNHPGGPGVDLIDIKNTAGRTALGEAALAEWDEGVDWFVGVVKLDVNETEGGDVEDADVGEPTDVEIEVEVEDADGQLSKMSIRADGSTTTTTTTTVTTEETKTIPTAPSPS